jgi:hypothetical protein
MKKVFKKFVPILSIAAFTPFVAFAQSAGCSDTGLSNVLCNIAKLLSNTIPVLVALGVVYFVWGVVTYVIADSEEAKKGGKDRMIFGIIGFVVIIALWALVNVVLSTFFSGTGGATPTSSSLQQLLPQ